MEYKYFAYCPDSGFETFQTREEAEKYAQEAIDWFRDSASEGWNEEVSGVCWGEIKQETVMTCCKTVKEAEEELGVIIDATCYSGYADYGLKDV